MKKVLVKNVKNTKVAGNCAEACDKGYSVGTPGGEEKKVKCGGFHFMPPKTKGKKVKPAKCQLFKEGVSKTGRCSKKYTCCEKFKDPADPCTGYKKEKKKKKCLAWSEPKFAACKDTQGDVRCKCYAEQGWTESKLVKMHSECRRLYGPPIKTVG
jgi:hypothetical protein